MSVTAKRFFVVQWRDLDRWVVPSSALLSRSLPAGWRRVTLRDVLQLVNNAVKVDASTDYKMAGVKWYGEGVFHRETVRGDGISAKWISPLVPGALIYNRLFAWKASFAVVPQELGDCHVSNEFPQFVTDPNKLLPEYLCLWCISDQTVKAVNSASTGSSAVSRNRFREEFFLDFRIPLPPMSTQRKIVATREASRTAADATAAEIDRREREIDARFLADLGLTAPERGKLPKCFAVRWRDFERWGVNYNQYKKVGADLSQGTYPAAPLESCLSLVQYGTSEKANAVGRGTPVLRINNVKGKSIDLTDVKHVEIAERVKAGLLLKDGDILVIRTSGSRDLVGTSAVFHEAGEYVFASYLIRLRVDPSKANPDFVVWFLNSPLGRQQVDAISRQIMQNNINSEEIRSLELSLPPPTVQKKIVERIMQARNEIAKLRAEAATQAEAARADVEAMILGTKPVKA